MTGLLSEAFAIMVTGMVTVFVFLSILIGAMTLLRMLADKPELHAQPGSAGAAQEPSPKQLAAITAAVHQYRRTHTSHTNK